MTSLTCCYTSETNPDCDARRYKGSPMCQFHLYETLRDAVYEDYLPPDVLAEWRRVVAIYFFGQFVEKRRQEDDALNRYADFRDNYSPDAVVYYVRLSGDRVKIGTTKYLADRMKALRARPEDLLAWEPGWYDVETLRHRQFAHLRLDGRVEEFRDDEALTAWIDKLRRTHGDPVMATRPAVSDILDSPGRVL